MLNTFSSDSRGNYQLLENPGQREPRENYQLLKSSPKRYRPLEVILGVLTALVVLTVVAQSIVSTIIVSNQNALQRYCGIADGVLMGSGSPGTANAMIRVNSNERKVGWDIQYKDLQGVVTGLAIHGPVPYGLSEGPSALVLCGSPSTLACDLTVAGHLYGELNPQNSGDPLKPIIQAIRSEPWRYALRIKTSAHPDGELKMWFTSSCGTAE